MHQPICQVYPFRFYSEMSWKSRLRQPAYLLSNRLAAGVATCLSGVWLLLRRKSAKGLQIVCDVVIWELAAPSNNAAPRRNCRRDVRKICHIALVITQKWRMPFAPLHWRRCRRAVRLLDCVNQPPRVIWRC